MTPSQLLIEATRTGHILYIDTDKHNYVCSPTSHRRCDTCSFFKPCIRFLAVNPDVRKRYIRQFIRTNPELCI